MDWFLYDNGLRHERVKQVISIQADNRELRKNVPNNKKYI